MASADHSDQGQLMDHAGDLGDDYKFGQDQVFQDSSHHNYKMIKASVLSGPDLKHNLQRGLRLDSAAVSIIVVILRRQCCLGLMLVTFT